MTTCEPLPLGGEPGRDLSRTWSAAASHARTSVTLDAVPALRASTADYGLTSPRWFARYDPSTSSWRTRQASFHGEWAESSETWPQAGTARNGTAYRRRPSARRTYERASGFWPTPIASGTFRRKTPYGQGGVPLSFVLGGLPHPRFVEWLMGFPPQWCETSSEDSATP
jgi:hypothetical protein